MSGGFGHAAFVGFAKEAIYGSAVASAKFLEIESENFKSEQGFNFRPKLGSATQGKATFSSTSVNGGFTFPFTYDGAELLLKYTLGSNTTTGTNPYTHTMTGSVAIPSSLTFHVNRDAANVGAGSAFRYQGCHISKLTFKQEMDAFLMCTVEVVGQDFGNEPIETPNYPTFTGADYSQLTTTFNDSTITNVRSMELTIDNNYASGRYQLDTPRLHKAPGRAGPRKVSGSMELEFDSLTEYAAYRDSTDAGLIRFHWVQSAGAKELKLSMNNAYLQGSDPEVPDASPILWTANFEAFSTTEGSELEIVNINAVSSIA